MKEEELFENREQDGVESIPSLTKTDDIEEGQNTNAMLSLVPVQAKPQMVIKRDINVCMSQQKLEIDRTGRLYLFDDEHNNINSLGKAELGHVESQSMQDLFSGDPSNKR